MRSSRACAAKMRTSYASGQQWQSQHVICSVVGAMHGAGRRVLGTQRAWRQMKSTDMSSSASYVCDAAGRSRRQAEYFVFEWEAAALIETLLAELSLACTKTQNGCTRCSALDGRQNACDKGRSELDQARAGRQELQARQMPRKLKAHCSATARAL